MSAGPGMSWPRRAQPWLVYVGRLYIYRAANEERYWPAVPRGVRLMRISKGGNDALRR